MNNKEEKTTHIRSVEKLHHFSCPVCKKWWSVADAPVSKKKCFCPWCGTETAFTIAK